MQTVNDDNRSEWKYKEYSVNHFNLKNVYDDFLSENQDF